MSPTGEETCSKCGRLLSSSQQACVFGGMIVCTECHKKLRSKQINQQAFSQIPIFPDKNDFIPSSTESIQLIGSRRIRPVWYIAGIFGFVMIVALLKSNGDGNSSEVPRHDNNNTNREYEKNTQQPPPNPKYIEIREILTSAMKEIPLSFPDGKTIVEKGIGQENIRIGPGMSYASDNTGTLYENEKLYVLEEKDGWIRFRVTPEDCNWSAWINKDLTISQKELRDMRVAKFGEPPKKSYLGIDCVVEYLLATVRDPESLKFEKWSDIFYSEDGWVVLCEFRAKNGFGGYNRDAKWFIIQHGRVVDMKNIDAYK